MPARTQSNFYVGELGLQPTVKSLGRRLCVVLDTFLRGAQGVTIGSLFVGFLGHGR